MYCPKCGEAMVWREGELWCVPGEMPLSKSVQTTLAEMIESAPPSTAATTSVKLGEEWFCPADGARMVDAEGGITTCPSCGRVLGLRLIYELVELHPHRRWPA
jgi:predicted RNA-binding Zn-ribbon protein involved in translation (DUF1610 family)